MKIRLAALLLAGSAVAAGSGLTFDSPDMETFSRSKAGNILTPETIHRLLPSFNSMNDFRGSPPGRDASIIGPSGVTSPEKLASPTLSDIFRFIRAAANKHGVHPAFVESIVAAESNFKHDAVSLKGAIGLMQLMPATAREYGADPNIPEQNIEAGTRYLKVLMKRYGGSRNPLVRTIAAYNAGPGAVDRHHGVPPFRETRGYVVRVLAFLRRFLRERSINPTGRNLASMTRHEGDAHK